MDEIMIKKSGKMQTSNIMSLYLKQRKIRKNNYMQADRNGLFNVRNEKWNVNKVVFSRYFYKLLKQ